MLVIDKIVAAMAPIPDEQKRLEATERARAADAPGDRLSLVRDHHDRIREAFSAGKLARSAADRTAAMKELAIVLAYLEQTTAKNQMAELENIAPSKPEWLDEREHIEGAVLTHMYEKESGGFLELREKAENPARLTARYAEEDDRCVG